MTPTSELRFVEREERDYYGRPVLKRILQQKWEDRRMYLAVYVTDSEGNPLPSPNKFEWRDVPVVKEGEQ